VQSKQIHKRGPC